MKLLALETSTETCSAALHADGECRARSEHAPGRHAELLLPMIDALLAEAGFPASRLDAIGFGRGPGSFTGLRVGAGVVQGIAWAAALPVIPISSLAVLAQAALGQTRILSAIDARMGQIYCAGYYRQAQGLVHLEGAERLLYPAQLRAPDEHRWYGTGSGWKIHGAELAPRLGRQLLGWDDRDALATALIPLALDSARRGAMLSAEQAVPVYLRDQVAQPASRQ